MAFLTIIKFTKITKYLFWNLMVHVYLQSHIHTMYIVLHTYVHAHASGRIETNLIILIAFPMKMCSKFV